MNFYSVVADAQAHRDVLTAYERAKQVAPFPILPLLDSLLADLLNQHTIPHADGVMLPDFNWSSFIWDLPPEKQSTRLGSCNIQLQRLGILEIQPLDARWANYLFRVEPIVGQPLRKPFKPTRFYRLTLQVGVKREVLASGPCVHCGGPAEHVDHILPLALGGTDARTNLQPSCQTCNLKKGSKRES